MTQPGIELSSSKPWVKTLSTRPILSITFLNDLNLIYLQTVKGFQVLLHITNYSVKYQSFVDTQVNYQAVLFQTIQFSISHLFAQSLCQTVLFDPYIGSYQVLLLQTRVDLQ